MRPISAASAGALQEIKEIVEVLSNPEALKKSADEMLKLIGEIRTGLDESAKKAVELVDKEAKLLQKENDLKVKEAIIADRQKAQDLKEKEIAKMQASASDALLKSMQESSKLKDEKAKWLSQFDADKKKVDVMLSEAELGLAKAMAMKAEYEEKLGKLKALMG